MGSLVSTQLDVTNVSYPASVGNEAEKAKCIGDAIMGPHSYLDGQTLEYKDPEDEWTTVVNFGKDVKKVVKNSDGSIKKSVSLGTFKGIDQEANMVFADGDTCLMDLDLTMVELVLDAVRLLRLPRSLEDPPVDLLFVSTLVNSVPHMSTDMDPMRNSMPPWHVLTRFTRTTNINLYKLLS